MKTAEEIYNQNGCDSKRDIIDAMKEFAIEVSKESLKNAANNVDPENCFRYSSERNTYDTVEQSILSESNIPKL